MTTPTNHDDARDEAIADAHGYHDDAHMHPDCPICWQTDVACPLPCISCDAPSTHRTTDALAGYPVCDACDELPAAWPNGHLIILEGDGLPRKLERCDCGGMSSHLPSHRFGPVTDSLTAGRMLAGRDVHTGRPSAAMLAAYADRQEARIAGAHHYYSTGAR